MNSSEPDGATPSRPKYPALATRNFKLLWSGQAISLTGTMMQNMAVLWHVSLLAEKDERALALGLVGLARVIPIVAFALFAGVVADAYDRRRVMIVTQSAMALCAVALAALSISGHATLNAVLVLTGLTAAASCFDGPARSALVPTLVPREHIGNAVSLNTVVLQLARVIGPALAGVGIAFLDVSWIYFANGVSFVAVIAALLWMRDLPERPARERAPISVSSALEGVRFAFATPLLRATMLLDFVAAFFAAATTMLPLVVQDVLQVGPLIFGWLGAAPSIGAVAASAWMVRHEHTIQRKGQVLLWSIAAFGIATVAFGLSRSVTVVFVCLALTGAADTVNMVLRNVLRQLITPDRLRGRMSAVNFVFSQGGPELGEVEAGVVAQAFGVGASIVSGGIGCLASTGWIAWRTPELRAYGTGEFTPAAPARLPAPAVSPLPQPELVPARAAANAAALRHTRWRPPSRSGPTGSHA